MNPCPPHHNQEAQGRPSVQNRLALVLYAVYSSFLAQIEDQVPTLIILFETKWRPYST